MCVLLILPIQTLLSLLGTEERDLLHCYYWQCSDVFDCFDWWAVLTAITFVTGSLAKRWYIKFENNTLWLFVRCFVFPFYNNTTFENFLRGQSWHLIMIGLQRHLSSLNFCLSSSISPIGTRQLKIGLRIVNAQQYETTTD